MSKGRMTWQARFGRSLTLPSRATSHMAPPYEIGNQNVFQGSRLKANRGFPLQVFHLRSQGSRKGGSFGSSIPSEDPFSL
jgi:hypothetical protein